MDDNRVRQLFQDELKKTEYNVAKIPYHIHNGTDSPLISTQNTTAGVSSVTAGTGITVSPTTGAVTVTNAGVTSLTAGTAIGLTGSTGGITVNNTGVTALVAGTGISLSGPTGSVTVTATHTSTAKFGGDGTDGSLVITSGTTTLNLGGASVYIKNYTSIEISGTGALAFSNPATAGTMVVLRSQGSVMITSSATPCIELTGIGSAGGAAQNGSGGGTVNGNPGSSFTNWGYQGNLIATTGGNFGSGGTAGGGGGAASAVGNGNNGSGTGSNGGIAGVAPAHPVAVNYAFSMVWPALPGGGGGAGCNNSVNPAIAGTAGGIGGGGLMIECNAGLAFTGVINTNGGNGTSSGNGGVAGGGGGAGGTVVMLYNTLLGNSGTVNATAGTHGTGGASAGIGGDGAAGVGIIAQNYIWA